jgi:hypothetical protein
MLDDRNGVNIWHSTGSDNGVRLSNNESILVGSQIDRMSYARFEKNRNIVSNLDYWRWDSTTSTYNQPVSLPSGASFGSSATLQRVSSPSGTINKWNLATTSLGLAVAEDDGAFRLGPNRFWNYVTVTEQGWFVRQEGANESQVWVKGKWTNLYEILGDGITSANILKIIDTGHIVARLHRSQDPYFIARLLPVELEQKNDGPSNGIRFCRWLDSFTGNTIDSDAADKDRDRFRITIPSVLPNLTKIHIKSSALLTAVIDGQWVSKSTDGDYDVTMTEENGDMVSKWMLLVSDGDDDVGYNGSGTDNGTNDQTLLANFNSSIEVTLPEYQNVKVVFSAQKPGSLR